MRRDPEAARAANERAAEAAARLRGTPKPSRNGRPAPSPPVPAGRGLATTGLDGIRPRPVRWLVDRYIPLGKLTMIAGDGGNGKSTLTLALAAAVTTGRAAFGLTYFPYPPADVLLISCEDDYEDTIVPRLLASGANLGRVRRVDGVQTPDGSPAPFSLAHFRQLEEELEDHPDVRLVVIDPAGAYIGRAGVDDHKDSELRALLGPLAELAGRRGVAILLVKHLNKGASAKAVHRVGGSVGYVNAVRVAFIVAPHPDEDGLKLFLPVKLNIGKQPPGLSYSLDPLPDAEAQGIVAGFSELADEDRARLAADLFRPTWRGAADMDADTALREAVRKDHPGGSKVDEVAEWLVGFLGEFSWPDSEVEAAAKVEGFTFAQLKRAKAQQRQSDPPLVSKKRGFGKAVWWNWIGDKDVPKLDRPTPYTPRTGVQNVHNGENGQNGSGEPPDIVLSPGNPHSVHSRHSAHARVEYLTDPDELTRVSALTDADFDEGRT
ncbi:MAG TPA: AAA family ATPase [Fimbriiglobus sp.]|nr:AAA family ATPase [Fimbriiglobus sp.]